MMQLRKGETRGGADHGWLRTFHTFSFADYFDPDHMGFGSLRVLNEDFVAPGKGFGTHPHRDMEILTYVLRGALRHKDSMGNGSVIRPGEVQIMSAGTGIQHSEFNESVSEPVHLLQIWIEPRARGLAPRYDQKSIERAQLQGKLLLIAAPPGEAAVVPIHQDARLFATVLAKDQAVALPIAKKRLCYVQVATGQLEVNGQKLAQGDGAALVDEPEVRLRGGTEAAEALVFDLG